MILFCLQKRRRPTILHTRYLVSRKWSTGAFWCRCSMSLRLTLCLFTQVPIRNFLYTFWRTKLNVTAMSATDSRSKTTIRSASQENQNKQNFLLNGTRSHIFYRSNRRLQQRGRQEFQNAKKTRGICTQSLSHQCDYFVQHHVDLTFVRNVNCLLKYYIYCFS